MPLETIFSFPSLAHPLPCPHLSSPFLLPPPPSYLTRRGRADQGLPSQFLEEIFRFLWSSRGRSSQWTLDPQLPPPISPSPYRSLSLPSLPYKSFSPPFPVPLLNFFSLSFSLPSSLDLSPLGTLRTVPLPSHYMALRGVNTSRANTHVHCYSRGNGGAGCNEAHASLRNFMMS